MELVSRKNYPFSLWNTKICSVLMWEKKPSDSCLLKYIRQECQVHYEINILILTLLRFSLFQKEHADTRIWICPARKFLVFEVLASGCSRLWWHFMCWLWCWWHKWSSLFISDYTQRYNFKAGQSLMWLYNCHLPLQNSKQTTNSLLLAKTSDHFRFLPVFCFWSYKINKILLQCC